jgi:preprotein translocase subunit SecA
MFSFFKKKDQGPKVSDLVFATNTAKLKALAGAASQDRQPVFIAWFDNSQEQLQRYFQQQHIESDVLNYKQANAGNLNTSSLIFIEHYPLAAKEAELYERLYGKNISVYSSLDEPFFRILGGENIAALLSRLGLNDDEAIGHPMITKSIQNAQEKLAKKVVTEHSASSMEEWFRKNIIL